MTTQRKVGPLTLGLMEVIADRELDVELLSKMGFGATKGPNGIDMLAIPFVRDGEVVRRKYRALTPDAEGKRPMFQDVSEVRSLFNEDALKDASLRHQPIIITEGELDCVAAIQCGFLRSVSVPDGAPQPNDPEKVDRYPTPIAERAKYSWFASVKQHFDMAVAPEIIIASDNDAPGAQMLEDLGFLFSRSRCKYLVYPLCSEAGKARPERHGRTRCKDLNEVLQDWGHKGVQKTIENARWLVSDGVYAMSELAPVPDPETFVCPMPGMEEHYTLRMSDWGVVTGIPSLGKSTLANDIYSRFADKYGLRVAIASFEQHPQIDHKRNLRNWFYNGRDWTPTLQQEADDWIDKHYRFLVPSEDEDVTLDWLFEKLEMAVIQHGCRIIILDPWNELDHVRERDETLTEYVGRAIKAMKKFARKFNVHFVVVAHPAKQMKDKDTGAYKEPTLYDVSDSAHWYNKADFGFIVHRDEDGSTLRLAKSRYHDKIGKPARINIEFNPATRRFTIPEGDGRYRVPPMPG